MSNEKQIFPFLSLVAEDLLDRFGHNLANITVAFPSRRARLFFNNYLYEHAQAPVWAPRYVTIDELFAQASGLKAADSIQLINELYKIYIDIYNSKASTPSTETLDEFFFFGEILLNDFDDVDKNLVNARSLFSNLQDLDELKDDFSHLNEDQIEALTRFFKFLGETPLKSAFWSIWNVLGDVYFTLKEKMAGMGIAYPGMIMRSVIEKKDISLFKSENYIFAGFNVLSKCEEALFKMLKEKSLFYWDIDSYYLNESDDNTNEAGRFIQSNIRKFGSALDPGLSDHFLSSDKKITFVASPSESGQASCISPWIESLNLPKEFTKPDTAIVLCNEAILPSVIHSIPSGKVENVNITMGFPITQTPICSFLQVLIENQVKGYSESGRSFRYKYVLPVLRHPYSRYIFPEAKETEEEIVQGNIFFPTIDTLKNKMLFSYASDTRQLAGYLLDIVTEIGKAMELESSDIYTGLYQESVFRTYQVINRLRNLLLSGDLEIEKSTFLRLMKKLLSTIKVPFHGEPVKGLQIMGVLETRTLDFKNLVLLSTNEGFMPGSENENSFIPQFLRKYFEMSTIEHQDSIYAYYFYRLLQRAENITLIYNTDKTQTGKSEMSRFLLQLLADPRITVERRSLQAPIRPLRKESIEIPKTGEILQKIKYLYDRNTNPEAKSLSPSALNVFIDCSLKFYLQYIEGLKSREELSEELDSSIFGTIFHRSAELLYREIGRVKDQKTFQPFIIKQEYLELMEKNPVRIDKIVARAFSEIYFKGKEISTKQYNGEQIINFRVIRHMLKRLIRFDKKRTPFYICGLEHSTYSVFDLEENNISVNIGGIIDRLEEKDQSFHIVDYKTNGTNKTFKTMEDLVIPKDQRASHVFQTFIYATVLMRTGFENQVIIPELLYLQDAGKDDYSPVIQYEKAPISDFREVYADFYPVFMKTVSQILDRSIPFRQTTVPRKCSYCDFKNLCNVR